MPLLDLDKYTQQMFVKYFFEAIFPFVCAYSTSKPICSITCHLEVLVNENRILRNRNVSNCIRSLYYCHTIFTQYINVYSPHNNVTENLKVGCLMVGWKTHFETRKTHMNKFICKEDHTLTCVLCSFDIDANLGDEIYFK